MPERYSRAAQSSHLETNNEHTTDVDVLIASGWVKSESLGTHLFRLRHEFDAVNKREIQQAPNSLTARLLTLMSLRTLGDTREALGRFSLLRATRERFMQPDKMVLKIAGRALDAWLDPMCPVCSGRGFNGGFGAPIVLCNTCGGSTRRFPQLANWDDGHQFGVGLMTVMDTKTEYVRKMMVTFLRTRPL